MPDYDGRIYVGDSEEPALILPSAIVAVLFDEGAWEYLNDQVGAMIDEYEADTIHVDRLAQLQRACRELARRYSDGRLVHRVVNVGHKVREGGGRMESDEIVWTATGDEVRQLLLELAALVGAAEGAGEPIAIVL